MSDCIYRGRLSDYLDGHLDPDTEAAVRRHLQEPSSCDCPQELEALQSLVDSLQDLPPGPAPVGGWERLEAALDAPERRVQRRRPRLVVAWAASLVLGVALLAWAFFRLGPDSTPMTPESRDVVQPPALAMEEGSRLRSPEVLQAVSREQLPPVRVDDDHLVRYGAELASLDSLIEAARALPAGPDNHEFQNDLQRLTSLREDLLTEMVLQAQAERTATWQ
jgi:hypothetical protein